SSTTVARVIIMTRNKSHVLSFFALVLLLVSILPLRISAQNVAAKSEEIIVATFPRDKKISVRFEADPDFSGATGQATIDLSGNGTATIKGEFKNLISPLDIGGQYSAYVLWAILANGSTERLGSLDVKGNEKKS